MHCRDPRLVAVFGAFAVASTVSLGAQTGSTTAEAEYQRQMAPFMAKNCLVCHGAERQLGDLNLVPVDKLAALSTHREDWKSILQMIESGEMPPSEMPANKTPPGGLPNPSSAERQAAVRWIKQEFERADAAIPPRAGRVTARRLNRAEYNNTIQDLLGIKLWPADEFPQDDAAHGFDNIADSLSLSPVLMEKYLRAAERSARTAVFGPETLPPETKKLEQLERDVLNRTEVPKEYDVTGLNTDRALHAVHRFPVDGEYLFRVVSRGFRPLGSNPLELGLWLDGKLVTELQVDPKEDGPSLLGGRQDLFGKPQEFRMFVPAGDHWVAASVLRMFEGLPPIYNGPNPSKRNPPLDVQPQSGPAAPANAIARDGAVAPANRPVEPPAPTAEIAAAPEAAAPAAPEGARRGGRGGRGGGPRLAPIDSQIGIDYVDIVGPYKQPQGPSYESAARLYPRTNFDRNARNAAHEVLARLLPQAFRRPVSRAEVAKYVGLYHQVRKAGDSFEEGIAVALQAVLVSPDFLYRIERDPPARDAEAPITGHELASRLSYFLWSSMPDDELREAADRGTLRRPGVLEQQVRRMLQSPKSVALAKNFAGQWLQVRAMESVTPDFNLFPDFDAYLRISMVRETELFFEHIVREDRSILEFLDANYSFLNERLAGFYGVPGVKGTEFRKVDLAGTPRGGVITHASVLTVSSYATRTSPVLRGKWILDNILNAPPPPPPNAVPDLEETRKSNPDASLREQLELHRKNPSCAGCHSRMDPLGVGLENFNAIGAWRTLDGKLPIDASGKLPDGRSFSGPAELRAILRADHQQFAACLVEKMFVYALGRGVEAHDRPTLKEITRRLEKNGHRFSALIIEIVQSLPFQKRTGEKP
jgi:mono/diheme cytochrome c family protein